MKFTVKTKNCIEEENRFLRIKRECAVLRSTRGNQNISQARAHNTTYARWLMALMSLLITAIASAGQTYTTSYSYDEAGNNVSQTDALGRITRWQYDVLGRVTGRTLPDGRQEAFVYDAIGNQTQHQAFDGETTYSAYNNLNQLVLISYPDGRQIRYTYTPTGKAATITSGVIAPTIQGYQASGTTTYTYDVNDRVDQVNYPNGRYITYAYDNVGNLASRTTSNGSTTYGYDAAGHLTQVTDTQGQVTTYSYDFNNRLSKTHYASGVQSFREYDVNGHLVQIAWQNAQGQVLNATAYTLLPNGQRQTIARYDSQSGLQVTTTPYTNSVTGVTTNVEHWALSNPASLATYTYDYDQRLIQEQLQDNRANLQQVTSWAYDAVGNRQSQTQTNTPAGGTASVTTATYSYDVTDRLSQTHVTDPSGNTTATTYSWDANGRLISKTTPTQVTQYGWRSDNRLIQIQQGPNASSLQTTASFAYDDNGNRIQRTIHVPDPANPASGTLVPQITEYLVDETFPNTETLEENQTAGTETKRTQYAWGKELISAYVNDSLATVPLEGEYEQDGLGSIIGINDSAGNLRTNYKYGAFGEEYSVQSGDSNSYRYAGEYTDPNIGFQYHRARWYDASSARFLSMDEFHGELTAPITLHKFIYANADPINGIDPQGYETLPGLSAGQEGEENLEAGATTNAAEESSGSVANKAGKEAEDVVKKAIDECIGKSKSGATLDRVTQKIYTSEEHGNLAAMPDFLLTVGNKLYYIEVKTKLPLKSQAEAFTRAAKQLQAAIDQKVEKTIGVSFRKLGDRAFKNRSEKILAELDGGPVQLINGFLDLMDFIGKLVEETCIETKAATDI